ncbi:MAG TPA: DMT family transporter, partial [Nitrospinota bacterium]|nr:DMT family transporter [Nitrospinota bacterium]
MLLTPVLWTLLSSLSFGCCYILARRGTVYCGVTLGTLISMGVNLLLLTIWALSTTPWAALADGRLWVFCLIGLFVPGFSRLLLISSVHKVGASRSSSIRAGAPLIATLVAVLWLKESPTPLNLAGIGAIVLGGVFLSKKSRNEPLWNRRDLIFPLGGTVLTAFRDVSVRFGLADYPYPVAGSWAATAVSMLVVLACWRWTRSPDEERPPPQGWMYFGALGVGVSVGFTTLFFAFQA